MSNPSTPPVSRFSLKNVLIPIVPLALLAFGVKYYLDHRAANEVRPPQDMRFILKNTLIVPAKLDAAFADDGELVAAVPKDANEQIDPDTLVFSVLGADLEKEQKTYGDLTAHLAKVTGKKIELAVWSLEKVDGQAKDLKDGKLHITAMSTGSVSVAVNDGGLIPFCTMADADGKFGYNMEIIVPADSPIKEAVQLKSKSIAFTRYSHSGFVAPIVLLWKEFKLDPGIDYYVQFIGGQKEVVKGVANGQYQAGAVASDLLKRMIASKEIDGSKVRSIYTSKSTFPPLSFGYAHQLKPELAAKIKTAFLEFPWEKTSIAEAYAPGGYGKFVPISYKSDWAPIREMDAQALQMIDESIRAKK